MYIYCEVSNVVCIYKPWILFLCLGMHPYYNHVKDNSLYMILLYTAISMNPVTAHNEG
jgi:hypothetical protein